MNEGAGGPGRRLGSGPSPAMTAHGFDELDELYREIILDHYRAPRNSRLLDDPDVEVEAENPFCGDEIILHVKVDDERLADIGLACRGCSISQSSGSLMAELLAGRSLAEIRELVALFRRLMMGEDLSEADMERLGDLEALKGVQKFPVRVKCALLAWSALEDALRQVKERA